MSQHWKKGTCPQTLTRTLTFRCLVKLPKDFWKTMHSIYRWQKSWRAVIRIVWGHEQSVHTTEKSVHTTEKWPIEISVLLVKKENGPYHGLPISITGRLSDKVREHHLCHSKIPLEKYRSHQHRAWEVTLLRVIISTHTRLNDNMYKLGLDESPDCPCRTERQTFSHIMFNCQITEAHKTIMINEIKEMYQSWSTEIAERSLDLKRIYCTIHLRTPA